MLASLSLVALVPADRRGSGDLATPMTEGLLAVATVVSVLPLLGTSGGSDPVRAGPGVGTFYSRFSQTANIETSSKEAPNIASSNIKNYHFYSSLFHSPQLIGCCNCCTNVGFHSCIDEKYSLH